MSLRQLITYAVDYSQIADLDQIEINNILGYANYEKLSKNDTIILNRVLETLRN